MWILSFLPNFIVHLVPILGVLLLIASLLVSVFPILNPYKLVMQIIGLIVLCFGLYLEGGLSEKKEWESKIAELQVKVKDAEDKAKKENVKVVQKIVKKTEYYRVRGNDIIKYVDREVTKYDSQCVIPKEFVQAHNSAAEKQK